MGDPRSRFAPGDTRPDIDAVSRSAAVPSSPVAEGITAADPQEALDRLLRDLRSRREGLSSRDAERRLTVAGTNDLRASGSFFGG